MAWNSIQPFCRDRETLKHLQICQELRHHSWIVHKKKKIGKPTLMLMFASPCTQLGTTSVVSVWLLFWASLFRIRFAVMPVVSSTAASTFGNQNRLFRCSWDEQWFSYKVAVINPVDWNSFLGGCQCSMGDGFAVLICSLGSSNSSCFENNAVSRMGRWEVGKLLGHGQNLPPPCKQESCQRHLELGLFVCLG